VTADWNPDIIHLHGLLTEGLLGVNLKKKYNKPLLVTVYGEDITRYSKQIPSNYFTKFTLKNSDAIICQSKFLQNEINSIGIYNKRFFIIPMGASTNKFKPRSKNKARKILNLPENKKISGSVLKKKGRESFEGKRC
jgi:glycosyltransferase involved in cell wall biosynthesis